MCVETEITRRDFLKGVAAVGASAAAWGGPAPARVLGANDRIRVGFIGAGWRGMELLKIFKDNPSADLVAVCDVYGPRREKGLAIAGPGAKAYIDYRELLDRKDIDAVVIVTPDHWHKQMLIDALHAGKDAYLEKPIMHSIEQGVEMVRAVEETKRIVQSGMQQRSWPHFIMGKQIVDSGKLGKITFIHAYWYQDYYVFFPTFPPVDRAQLDWKRFLGDAPDQPFTLEKFYWWRWFWDFGGGMLPDLLTHWIDVIQWYMGQPAPLTATGTGQLNRMPWQAPDTVTAAYEYPGKFMVTFTGAINSRVDDGGIEFRGNEATLKVSRAHLAVYPEKAQPDPVSHAPEPEIFVRSEREGTVDNVENFLDCVRSRKTPNSNIHVAFEAARTSWIGNASLKRGTKVAWDASKGQVA